MVYTCKASDNTQTLEKTVVFIDSIAPIIKGVKETQEIEFGYEFDALNGITATDNVDGQVEVVVSGDEVNTKAPKEYNLTYTAKDLSNNETVLHSKVIVLEPSCGANASWNGADCVCNKGYQGNAWSGCMLIPVKKPSNPDSGSNSNNGNSSSGNSGNSSSGNNGSGSSGIRPGTDPTLDACKATAENACSTGYICGGSDEIGWIYECD